MKKQTENHRSHRGPQPTTLQGRVQEISPLIKNMEEENETGAKWAQNDAGIFQKPRHIHVQWSTRQWTTGRRYIIQYSYWALFFFHANQLIRLLSPADSAGARAAKQKLKITKKTRNCERWIAEQHGLHTVVRDTELLRSLLHIFVPEISNGSRHRQWPLRREACSRSDRLATSCKLRLEVVQTGISGIHITVLL